MASESNDAREDTVTSHVIGSYSVAFTVVIVAAIIILFFPQYAICSCLPFLALCLMGFHTSIIKGFYIAFVWGMWMMLLFSPLGYLGHQYVYFGLYGNQ